jgi:hypothetical protein
MKKLLPIFLFSLAASFLHSAEPWARALTPWSWSFPRDHGAHPEFKTEWWYLTGNLDDEKGNPYGEEPAKKAEPDPAPVPKPVPLPEKPPVVELRPVPKPVPMTLQLRHNLRLPLDTRF